MKGGSCALTGHRILPDGLDKKLLFDELETLIKEGYDHFFCGMAEGFDLLTLGFLVELKERYPICLEACIPFQGQESSFSEENRELYRDLLLRCDRVTTLFSHYKKGCFLIRDRYMADCSDLIFAYCTKRTGGTAYTVRYAEQTGKKIKFSRSAPSSGDKE